MVNVFMQKSIERRRVEKMADVKMVTRRVVKSNTYKVYKVEGTTLIEIGEEKVKGKVSEK